MLQYFRLCPIRRLSHYCMTAAVDNTQTLEHSRCSIKFYLQRHVAAAYTLPIRVLGIGKAPSFFSHPLSTPRGGVALGGWRKIQRKRQRSSLKGSIARVL